MEPREADVPGNPQTRGSETYYKSAAQKAGRRTAAQEAGSQKGSKVDVIKERDLHQERSQRLVALDVKPGSWLRKKEGDRRLYGRMEMTSTDPGRQSRVVAIQGYVRRV